VSILVAYKAAPSGRLLLEEAAGEAGLRQTSLTVVHVSEAVDVDIVKAEEASLRAEIAGLLQEFGRDDVAWRLDVTTGSDVARDVLERAAETDVELVVVGARHRTPVGKLIMGSVTQTVLLHTQKPVLVVKTPGQT